jgi:hypothetical protein
MKKLYHIVWTDNWGLTYSDLVIAKDSYKAWKKLKWRHPFTTKEIISISEITNDD